jgi:hypothetical protein
MARRRKIGRDRNDRRPRLGGALQRLVRRPLARRIERVEELYLAAGDVLDNITLTWLTNTFISGARLYWECLANKISGAVAGLVGNEGGVVSEVINLESSGVEAPDRRPRHDEPYHDA